MIINRDREMTQIEKYTELRRNVFKKDTQVRLAIVELMNENTDITVRTISYKTKIAISSVRNYIQDLERAGELTVERKGNYKKSKILNARLTDGAIRAIYDKILTSIPENDRKRVLSILEKKVKNKNFRIIT